MKNGAQNNANKKEFFTVKEVADMLGISAKTAYGYARKSAAKGGPPVRRFGRNCIRFPKQKFLQWANGDI